MDRGTDEVITLSVELGAGGFGARPYTNVCAAMDTPRTQVNIYQITCMCGCIHVQHIHVYMYRERDIHICI